MHRILVVEDDPDISEITCLHLRNAGYIADQAYSLGQTQSFLERRIYSLILLDVLLPDGEGFDLCKLIREKSRCPIIFMSCIDDSQSVIHAFASGADDYVTKPVKYAELLARVEANIRRAEVYEEHETPILNDNLVHLKRFTIDKAHRCITFDGEAVELSSTEYALLIYFVEHRNTLLLYEELYNHVWGANCLGDVRTVLVHISNLRKKIDPEHAGIIETVRGAGYIFSDV